MLILFLTTVALARPRPLSGRSPSEPPSPRSSSAAWVVGFQKSVSHLGEVAADKRWIYLVNLSESLNNLMVALLFAALVSLLLTAGTWRRSGSGADS